MLLGALAWSAYNIDWSESIVHSGGGSSLVTLVKSLFTPELSPSFLQLALEATWVTIAYAVAGISRAVHIGISLGVGASRSHRVADFRKRTIEAPALSRSGGRRTDSTRGKLLIWRKDSAHCNPRPALSQRGGAALSLLPPQRRFGRHLRGQRTVE